LTLRRHGLALLAALVFFGVMTLASGTGSWAALIALVVLALAATALYFHYRRQARTEALLPITPARDDRVIPQDVKILVTVRDKGQCQLRYPGICLRDKQIQFDHRIPWSKGGSSKDPDNIQLGCGPCNRHKSDRMPV
jgi:hypothetical protein